MLKTNVKDYAKKSKKLVLPFITFTNGYRRLAENLMELLLLSLSRLMFLKIKKVPKWFQPLQKRFWMGSNTSCKQNKRRKIQHIVFLIRIWSMPTKTLSDTEGVLPSAWATEQWKWKLLNHKFMDLSHNSLLIWFHKTNGEKSSKPEPATPRIL